MENVEKVETIDTEKEVEERLYTSQEVTKIVQNRLSKLKKKYENILNEPEQIETENDKREKELMKRELKADAVELLQEKGLPKEFIDVLNLTDKEAFNKSLEALNMIAKKYFDIKPKRKVIVKELPEGDQLDYGSTSIRNAFAPKKYDF